MSGYCQCGSDIDDWTRMWFCTDEDKAIAERAAKHGLCWYCWHARDDLAKLITEEEIE